MALSEDEAFVKYLVKHKMRSSRKQYWKAGCAWQREQDSASVVKCSELYLACRELLRYDGIDRDRVRKAVDKIDRIFQELQSDSSSGCSDGGRPKDPYGQTRLLREHENWCHQCRQKRSPTQGRYIPLSGGKRQRWICYSCKPVEIGNA